MSDRPIWREALERFVVEMRSLYGSRLREVILYGSRARGDGGLESDIDTLVVLEPLEDFWAELSRIERVASRVSLEYDVVLSAIPASRQEVQQAVSPLLVNTRREGVSVG